MDILLKGRKRNYIGAGIAAGVFCLLMVCFPSAAVFSAQKGISLWANNVLPALLPFFICANFLNGIGAVNLVRPGLFPFVMSVLSGYPMGAKIIGDLRRKKQITVREAMRMISFCSTSGPSFMIGAVGVGMLNSSRAGMVIAAAHYIGAVLNGVLYSFLIKKEGTCGEIAPRKIEKGVMELFTEAIVACFHSLGMILVYIILFMFITDLLHMSGMLNFLPYGSFRAMAKGFFEMTVGCGALAECTELAPAAKIVFSAGVLSWGGLSIIAQSMSMLAGSGVPAAYFLLTKVTHCLFAGILALFFVQFMIC